MQKWLVHTVDLGALMAYYDVHQTVKGEEPSHYSFNGRRLTLWSGMELEADLVEEYNCQTERTKFLQALEETAVRYLELYRRHSKIVMTDGWKVMADYQYTVGLRPLK